MSSPSMSEIPQTRPGWPEILTALFLYMVGVVILGVWMLQLPDEQAILRINIGGAGNGLIGFLALFAAYALRIRNLRAFGFRMTERKWLLVAVVIGIAAFGGCFVIEGIYYHFITEINTQADFQTAAQGGPLSLFILIITGAILTPLSEEFVFRGVIANALNRYGAWAGVVGSAAIFGVIHGFTVILLDAFMVGILVGYLFRKTGSIWPGVVVHIVYNGLNLLYYSTL
ncbi:MULTISPECIES: CPBP family intramembrane glutamic endopeptidase [Paenibacillus]|uniref:CPBP family intramembrane glutamic endopeptidase n=1 Tax=Paenibacillus TaxID=44249 RepID=UPI000B97D26D|nr:MULTISPECIES: type II CAAX endopeptidase family protein [Paenibacillus]OZB90415.1 CPBP family intramembrane metalloprotease [Paenibacillus sp. XY044]UPK43342.1 CPBP family intramembrane metalloprotease [Paenibacillus pabuli]